MAIEVRRELWRITERRDGAIYKTVYVEDRWVDPDEAPPKDHQYAVKSSSFEGETIRRKK